jgi:thiol-disulfide isomerase/thioredoxin
MKMNKPSSFALLVSLGAAIILIGGACGNTGDRGAGAAKGSGAAIPPAAGAAKAAPLPDVKVFVDTSALPAAPDFQLSDLDGKLHSLSEYRGKVVFLNFWATWCGPCKAEIPELIRLHNQYADKGFTVVGVSIDRRGKADVAPFMQRKPIPYPVLLDARMSVPPTYGGIPGVPTTFIITQDGKIYDKLVGMPRAGAFEGYIRTLLGIA